MTTLPPLQNTYHPTTLANMLVQQIRKGMLGMKPEDKIDCLYELGQLLTVVQAEAHEDAEEAGCLVPCPESY